MTTPSYPLVLENLKEHGLLLETDARLPNVSTLVLGEPVRGSWWAHPRSHEIFRVNCALEDHPDALVTKLVSGKITFIHRLLWPSVVAIGRAREPWQIARLSTNARKLLARADKAPVETNSSLTKAASELEKLLLVSSEQFHTERGAHVRRLESWDHWRHRSGFAASDMAADQARRKLEEVLDSLNRRFHASGRLPWQ